MDIVQAESMDSPRRIKRERVTCELKDVPEDKARLTLGRLRGTFGIASWVSVARWPAGQMVLPTARSMTRRGISRASRLCLTFAFALAGIILFWRLSKHGEPHVLGSLLEHTTSVSHNAQQRPIKIAHATSIILCKNEAKVRGMMDALAVLRHSIHMNSVHAHPNSKYSYQMYAIIHKDNCNDPQIPPFLEQLGYIPIIKPTPVNVSEIQNEWYRAHVEGENCCGSAEFIKLFAYTLTDHPVVVHWDLDVAVLQPLDDLYDAIIYDKDSPQGRAARRRIRIQRPLVQKLPDRIDAFITRDVTSAKPWEKIQAVQGGFVVARPSVQHFRDFLTFILEGHYMPGRGEGSGWGGLGYGGFQGAMAYQGVLAYFYDVIHKGFHVELDVCRWNQVVADVIWRGPDGPDHLHQCRDYPHDGDFEHNTPENGECEDCRILPVEETMTAHYTACKKPWECTVPYPRVPNARNRAHKYRLEELTNITTCGKLFNKWFGYREELERWIAHATGSSFKAPDGLLEPQFFRGYCESRGSYMPMQPLRHDFALSQVYGF